LSPPIDEHITIKPKAKHNGLFITLLGFVFICISMLLNMWYWNDFKLQLMLLFFASFIVLLTGILKYSEPDISYKLTRQYILFFHRSGNWTIKWNSIIRLGIPTSSTGFNVTHLPYIGIKLKNITLIADNISPRLANKLIHEQRDLLILAAKNNEITLNEGLISFDAYTLNNKVYKGPIAAWLFRTEQLHSIYGYHLYLPDTGFDRNIADFLQLLKQCKDHASNP
jgi:hypothetical protein